MRKWPDVLPTPSMPGFGLSPIDPVMRTDMEGGYKRVRRTSFARQDVVDMAWVFTDAEMAAFRAWWNDDAWSLAGDSESLAGWGVVGATRVIGGATSPDGEIVDQVIETVATSGHYAERSVAEATAGGTVLFRATVKSAGRQFARLAFFDRTGLQCYTNVDLTAGTLGSSAGLTSRSIESRGNGWWRISMSAAVATGGVTPSVRINALSAAQETSYLGDGVSGLSIAEIGARMVTGYDLHLRTDAAGKALGAGGGAGWVVVPIAVGGGFKTVEARFNGPFKAVAGAGLNWDVSAQMEVRNA